MRTNPAWRFAGPALLMTLGLVPGLSAQVCPSPLAPGAGWVGPRLGSGTAEATFVGGEFGVRLPGSFSLSGELERSRFEGGTRGRRVGLELGYHLPFEAVPGDLCLTAGAAEARYRDVTVRTVPVGLSLSRTWSRSGDPWTLTPFVEPQVAYRRASIPSFTRESNPVTLRGGAVLGWERVFVRGTYGRELNEAGDWLAHVQLGWAFR